MEYAYSMQPILDSIITQAKESERSDILKLLSEYKSFNLNLEDNDVDMEEDPQKQEYFIWAMGQYSLESWLMQHPFVFMKYKKFHLSWGMFNIQFHSVMYKFCMIIGCLYAYHWLWVLFSLLICSWCNMHSVSLCSYQKTDSIIVFSNSKGLIIFYLNSIYFINSIHLLSFYTCITDFRLGNTKYIKRKIVWKNTSKS